VSSHGAYHRQIKHQNDTIMELFLFVALVLLCSFHRLCSFKLSLYSAVSLLAFWLSF